MKIFINVHNHLWWMNNVLFNQWFFNKKIMVYNLKYSNNNIIAKLLACFPCLKNAKKKLEILGNQYHKKNYTKVKIESKFHCMK
jgi:hypothetical protein